MEIFYLYFILGGFKKKLRVNLGKDRERKLSCKNGKLVYFCMKK